MNFEKIVSCFLFIIMFLLNIDVCFSEDFEQAEAYAVERGNIYFDSSTGTIIGADQTVVSADIPDRINGVDVTTIGSEAFDRCDLTTLNIPKSVINIETGAFYKSALTNINVDSENERYASLNGVLFNKSLSELIYYPAMKSKDEPIYKVPDNVTAIGDDAFFRTWLTSIEIPDSVTSIGYGAFTKSGSLTKVVIPSSVTYIGDDAFLACGNYLTIYGYKNSYAESYANKNNIKFEVIKNSEKIEISIQQNYEITATPTTSTLLVDGEQINFSAYNINGNNYFKLRDLAYILNGTNNQFDVGYDAEQNLITINTGFSYNMVGGEMSGNSADSQNALTSKANLIIDGQTVNLEAYNIGGNNFFMLRDLADYLGFEVNWDLTSLSIIINTK